MGISRRAALKGMVVAGAAAAGVRPAKAAVLPAPPIDAVGLLYDATLCIGCKTCTVACRDARGLAPDTSGSVLKIYDAPIDLSERTRTVIKLYRSDRERGGVEREGSSRAIDFSYVKIQCMHCVDPACTSACMLGALKKREFGIVSYDPALCVGCRYCEIACPFNVPKFQWSAAAPQIVKCELCRERLAVGRQPACTEVCPRKAVIFGKRSELLAEARRRLAAEPDKYIQKIYGETDGGGTQVLYISQVPFEQLGFPALGEEPAPGLARSIQHGVYKGFIAPVALYAALGAVMFRNRKHAQDGADLPDSRGENRGGRS
jgi:Fe-S-cluster-containing dehydrogenase component